MLGNNPFFFQPGRFSGAASQIIKFGPANSGPAYHFNFINTGRVIKEFPLYAHTMRGDTPDGKGLINAAALDGNNNTLKKLNPLTVAFNNTNMDINGISRSQFRPIVG